MSIAGIRSNRGDGYQTLVAFDWALKILSDQDFLWLEVDSISYPVDDVVVGKVDGVLIACQCKKNQTDFKAWTIADLGDELDKAFRLLANNPKVNVRFYSRNNFGDLAKLKEHSSSQPDESSYLQSLGKAQRVLNDTLSQQLAKTPPSISTFEFLRRTNFVTSDDLDQMEQQLRGRLRYMVSNPDAAFNALWVSLDKLGARMGDGGLSTAVQYRLTKDDLRTIVQQAGSILVPPMNLAEILHSFSSTSAIGRSWRRDIAGQRIAIPVVDELLAAIDARKRSILLTGLPGSGKTCVMLTLLEALEERVKNHSDIVPLFIQSREFADLVTSEDRHAQGLSPKWVEEAARMAEDAHVIVVIDSLDVLSIAREHRILKYFLAQIDRLLLLPNITVVTACRDFDRHYDRQIAERHWDCELKCQPWDWKAEITPLLDTLGIATAAINADTRELIRNPRELALFVELAQRDGSFNVVTSQALAQRYLNTVVLADSELGDIAIQAIEDIASEMLHLRSLVVPHQRFPASQDIQRKLCSLNVLQETQDGKLTFGHQTLLDVLVISRAMRNGVTLNAFINSLPAVPFVRPSIRSFIAQLAQGERREFRKQLRAVLVGNAAFHIRRLVAESFAEQKPQNEDWSLVRDLREKHRDIFQVIYAVGGSIEWHHFWVNFLIPYLKMTRDAEGVGIHVHRIAQWSNVDTAGVVSFWMEVLALDWFDGNGIADQLAMRLSEIKSGNIAIVAPLLERLITMPRSEHSYLGRAIAGCVTAGVVDDAFLWRYITDDISDEDLLEFRFNCKLRCQVNEFGNKNENFIRLRMEQSSALLDLALGSIERWSIVQTSRYGKPRLGYRHGFLSETSYKATHSQQDMHHVDCMDVLFDAVESGILHHAKTHSYWWKKNCERLCFNHEGALLYLGILACTSSPEANIDLIGRMLCDRNMLEFELSYELGKLIQSAFRFLPDQIQDAVMENILTVRNEYLSSESSLWKLRAQAEFIVPIPCYRRSAELQMVLDEYERRSGTLVCQPYIHSRGGLVGAPFSYDVFLSISNGGVLQLLLHYDGHTQRDWDEFLIGGEEEVGWQLREASSRQPLRFLNFLSSYWIDIPAKFRDDIMSGIATYLAYRYGNLNTNGKWEPLEEPNASLLANQILDELERHPMQWRYNSSSAKALEACANVIQDLQAAERLIFLAIGFAGLDESDPIEGESVDLITTGINMAKGDVTDALMILANNFLEQSNKLPALLVPTLRRFASDEHQAIRALILQRLPFMQNKSFDLGWDLFHLAMKDAHGLWQIAERCLYYAYHNHFDTVKPLLTSIYSEGSDKDFETWGRISALSAMTKHIDFDKFLRDLNTLDKTEAWHGATTVWVNDENIRQHREQCLEGIKAGLNADGQHALDVAKQLDHIFDDSEDVIFIPLEIVARCFSVFENEGSGEGKQHQFFRFHEWLNAISQLDPEQALAVTEIYLAYARHNRQYLYDHNNSLTQLMTRLFAEAEEREESDQSAMLQRVVALQDMLLSMGVNGVSDWLKAAERP
ncbi:MULTISPECIES: NACHT domain-containing protein [unclassified Brenneria]|uniref:NACHT domain-containing protein n=1 Tax=unclassified Brenneria TaxID=2634434 RepID=UPI001551FA95|nr:ATP-binding protein [Brenneria sp. hezel4-2-4]MEE3652697.1 ATP-binding protein [Brenneria sp. HEZEL_4_2_4]NPD02655.1 ATP-binding protein [Brenneria sp. hezel4-2-4]